MMSKREEREVVKKSKHFQDYVKNIFKAKNHTKHVPVSFYLWNKIILSYKVNPSASERLDRMHFK